jgi:glucosamine kinase
MSSTAQRLAPSYLIGVDGGGSGTRLVLADTAGRVLARAQAGPSALALGAASAWAAIESAAADAFAQVGGTVEAATLPWPSCILVCGLAGVNHAAWRQAFVASAPRLRQLVVESDAYTALLGAHQGAPGVVIALGTGSIGAVLNRAGRCETVGGYGFPSSDEASGAWLGLRAMQYAQYALDGRASLDAYAGALLDACGAHTRETLIAWLAAARQADYAGLAPTVLAHRRHPFVLPLLEQAGLEIARMIAALDPSASLPVALTGGLALALAEWVPQSHHARLVPAAADSAAGALWLALQTAGAAIGRP